MAKISAELDAFYGYGCGFQSYGSNETVEIEVLDNELEALKKFGKKEMTAEDIVAAIEGGDSTLESLHEQLSEKFYYMVEEYWLYEAHNECLYECLADHIEQDISDGLYTPEVKECDGFDCHCWAGDDDKESEEEPEDDENKEGDNEDYDDEEENGYDLDAYFEWIKEHNHEFAAERIGLNLDACRDDEVNYTIFIE
jgi:hypothetical protein